MSVNSRQITIPFAACEGKPYIFASYGHNDKDKVFPILKILYEAGYNVWYDQGISIGADYDQTIKEHVLQSAVVIFFESDWSLSREYILDNELPVARESHSDDRFLVFRLEDDVTVPDRAVGNLPEKYYCSIEKIIDLLSSLGIENFGKRSAVSIERDVPLYWYDDYELDPTGGTKNCVYTAQTPYVCLAFDAGDISACNPYAKELLFAGYNVRSCESEDAEGRAGMIADPDCAGFVPFLTKKYIESGQLEKDYAVSKEAGKPLIALYMQTYDESGKEEEYRVPGTIEKEFTSKQGLSIRERTVNDFLSELEATLEKRGCYASVKDGKVERRSFEIRDFLYELTDEAENKRKAIVLNQYTGNADEPVIKRSYGGYPVRIIGKKAFCSNESLRSAVIPEGVTEIRESAFSMCSNLSDISFPSTLEHIEYHAFAWCGIRTVRISDLKAWCASVRFDGGSAHFNCAKELYVNGEPVKDLVIPEGVSEISANAFREHHGITSVTIPKDVKHIGDGVFCGCMSLISATLPQGLESIGSSAFSDCRSLPALSLPQGLETIGDRAFARCRSLTTLAFPAGLRSIGNKAFFRCEALTSITLDDELETIDEGAFAECGRLSSVVIPGSVERIGTCAFEICRHLASVVINDGVKTIGWGAFQFCDDLRSATIPDSVTVIEDGAFLGENKLTRIKLPKELTSLPANILRDCKKLSRVELPGGITSIGNYAFYSSPKVIVYCPEHSQTWITCIRKGIPHKPLKPSFKERLSRFGFRRHK